MTHPTLETLRAKEADGLFCMILDWLRLDSTDFERGYTEGFIAAISDKLELWQVAYIRIVSKRIQLGVSA